MSTYESERHDRVAAEMDLMPCIICPKCSCGSDETMRRAIAVGEWGNVDCPSCKHSFLVAHAIDEMFMSGISWGYAFWLGCKHLTKYIRCAPGETKYLRIPDEFDEVYKVSTSFLGGYQTLAGGLLVEYTVPGMLMAAVAGPVPGFTQHLHMYITLIGRAPNAPPLVPWQRLVLEARLAPFNGIAIAPIHAVSAIDLFVEAMTGQVIAEGRPGSWNAAIEICLGVSLRVLVGKQPFQDLERLVQIRNKIAHGIEYVDRLPVSLQAEEQRWRVDPKLEQGDAAIPPSSEFSVRTALTVIRAYRQRAFLLAQSG